MNLSDYRSVDEALVWKAGELAATLTRASGSIVFAYQAHYRGEPVATSLPLQEEPVHTVGGALPPFFTGLLPEGRRLSALQANIKTSLDDELTLLLAVGDDVVGDVQVTVADPAAPNAGAPVPPNEQASPVVLEEASFSELFERAVGPLVEDRVALAGVQDKISGRMITLPVADRQAAWILKLDPPEFPGLVQNEAFFLEAARRSGLEVASARVVHDREGQPGLLVQRFDRSPDAHENGTFHRWAQEDACQVLGRYPGDKYRLSTQQVISGLAQRTAAPLVAARNLLQQFAFAYLTCNGDAHGKNFSILRAGHEWKVAPAYDLPTSHPYGDTTTALTLAGKNREDIGRADFVELGQACGVPEKATARVLDKLLKAAPEWMGRLEDLPFDAQKRNKLRRACAYRAQRLA